MSEIELGENSPSFAESFKHVAVQLDSGHDILMHKCLKCGFFVRHHGFTKHTHWRHCPSQWNFRYLNHDESLGCLYNCMKCGLTIDSPTSRDFRIHYVKCKSESTQDAIDYRLLDEQNAGPYIHESVVSKREISEYLRSIPGQCVINPGPGFRNKYIHNGSVFKRYTECQICSRRLSTNSGYGTAMHRRVCPLPVLFSINTQPSDPTISSSSMADHYDVELPASPDELTSTCFICNTKSSESFVGLYDTVSSHSNTPLYDFVWRLLDDQPSVRDDSVEAANSNWSLLCAQCFNKINQYDLACSTVAKLEKELRDDLALTEALYAPQQQIDEANSTEDCVSICDDDDRDPFQATSDIPDGSGQQEGDVAPDNDTDDANAQCIIELSDGENEDTQAIELSDDEN